MANICSFDNLSEKNTYMDGDDRYTYLEFTGTDCDYNWGEISEEPFKDHSCRFSLESFKELWRSMIEKTIKLGKKPILLSLTPLNATRFFSWSTRDLDSESILEFFDHDIESLNEIHESYNSALYDLSKEYGTPIIDVYTDLAKALPHTDVFDYDGLHLNEKGQSVLKSIIAGKSKKN